MFSRFSVFSPERLGGHAGPPLHIEPDGSGFSNNPSRGELIYSLLGLQQPGSVEEGFPLSLIVPTRRFRRASRGRLRPERDRHVARPRVATCLHDDVILPKHIEHDSP